MLEAQYRALTSNGAFQIARPMPPTARQSTDQTSRQRIATSFRGYIDANGTLPARPELDAQRLDPRGDRPDLPAPLRHLRRRPAALDDQGRADRRRQLSLDRRLGVRRRCVPGRSAEASSRSRCRRSTIACAAPDPLLGGTFTFQANTLGDHPHRRPGYAARLRQRAVGEVAAHPARPGGDLHRLWPRRRLSQRPERPDTATVIYRGMPGWQARGIGAIAGRRALAVRRRVPRRHAAHHAARPDRRLAARSRNLAIPNEDARAIDLEDSNLFALNRFPGYDRWEDGARVTYGARICARSAALSLRIDDRPELSLQSTRARRSCSPTAPACPTAPRTSSAARRCATAASSSVTDRFRLDKDELAIRRNEIDATIGDRQDLCRGRLSQAQPPHRHDDRGSARSRGNPARRPRRVRSSAGRSSARP